MGFKLVTKVGVGTNNPRVLGALARGFLRGVVACNVVTIKAAQAAGKPIPELYKSGVKYRPEPRWGYEEFADIITVLRRGWGDCDDLAAWRCAELMAKGEKCDIRLYYRPKTKIFHVEVRRANGDIEDPSRFLGL